MQSKFIFVDTSKIVAISDIWFISDKFIHDHYHMLPLMLVQANMNKRDKPYMYDQYNVKCFTRPPLSQTRSVPVRIVNSLVKALNEAQKLPRFVIVILDWDILKYADHSTFGVEKVMKRILSWMISNLVRVVEMKKDQLYHIKKGAINASEPKFVWVKMLQRMMSQDKILTVRGKYNWTLENLLADKKYHYVIDPNPILCDHEYFTQIK